METLIISSARKLAYVLAVCVIAVALFIVASRLLVPVFAKHRPEIEQWASQLLDATVTIDKVRLSWYQYQPVITLDRVTVLDKQTKKPTLQVNKVSVFFSLLSSLWQRQLVPAGILISGSDINIYQNANGEFSIQGFPSLGGFNGQPFQDETKFRDVVNWLATESRLILQDIDVRYTQATGQKYFVTLYNLSLRNDGAKHVINGKAILHQDVPTEVTLTVRGDGDPLDTKQFKAETYLYVSGVSLSQWLAGHSWNGWSLNKGAGTVKLWVSWAQGAFQRIQATFQIYSLELNSQTDKSIHNIERISADIGWKRDNNNNYVFAANDVLIDLPQHLWPVSSFYIVLSPNATGVLAPKSVTLGYLDLNDIQPYLFSSPQLLSDTVRTALKSLQVKGSLQEATVNFPAEWSDWQHWTGDAKISQLSVQPWKAIPGVKNLSGKINWSGESGDLLLNSHQTIFKYDSIFANPLTIDQISGDVHWQLNNDEWEFIIKSMQLLNKDLSANIGGSITLPKDGAIYTDIKANFSLQQAKYIEKYLPLKIFDKGLVEWLHKAFLSGEVKSASAVLKGKLADFPFDQNNGAFIISGQVNNIGLQYAPDWPALMQISGKLVFSGRSMTIDVDHARMLDIPITNAHAEIPNLGDSKPQMLYVKSQEIKGDIAQGVEIIHASPLEKKLGSMFSAMELHGPMSLLLSLTVPLSNPDNTQVSGDVNFNDAQMLLVSWHLQMDHLSGLVHFTEATTSAEGITGQLFNKPAQLDLATIQKSKTLSIVRATLTNSLAVADLENWLKMPFTKVATGEADIKAQVDFSLHAPTEILLTSNLVGVALDLPEPYAKKPQDTRDLTATITAQPKQPLRMKVAYAKLISAALILNQKLDTYNLSGIDLRLGGGDPAWPAQPGLYISGNLNTLDWDQIKSYMTPAPKKPAAQAESFDISSYPLRAIDVTIGKLDLLGQQITQARIQATPVNHSGWDVDITSPQVKGEIQVPANLNAKSEVSARFDKLSLSSNATPKPSSKPAFDLKLLPAIDVIAQNVTYNNMPLGQIELQTSPIANGQNIEVLRISSPRVIMQASGTWTQSSTAYSTHLKGKATSERVSDLLNSFGIDASNFVAHKGQFNFDLNWHDAFYAPTLASLNGKASLDLGPGRIVDIGQSSGAKMDLGRMLSIFSLQTIPRRLSFDFSDIFQKGYSFDSLRGDYTINNGNVNTANMRFDGPVAKVAIAGRIGLSKKDLDFVLSVTPYVTSSLPIAATLITANPLIGLGALAVNTVIGSQVSKVITYHYAVSGSWSNPSWKTINAGTR